MAYSQFPPIQQGPPGGPVGGPPPEPVRPPRPATVTAAVACIVGIVVIMLLGAITSVVYRGVLEETSRVSFEQQEEASGTSSGIDPAGFVTAIVAGTVVTYLILSLLLLLLATFVLRGRNWARVTTFVVAGTTLLCCGLTSVFGLATGGGGVDGVTIPAAYTAISVIQSIGLIVLPIVIIVLLALPASNRFFRPPAY